MSSGRTLRSGSSNSSSIKPSVAWLVSFPNSGTSYTLRLVRRATLETTATNNGLEQSHIGKSVPYHPSQPNGPFLHKFEWEIPTEFILTKTHCAGYCSDCAPHIFLETPTTFEDGCLVTRGFVEDNGANQRLKKGSYDIKIVKRVVHLVRNPFDNAVSRFHLQHNEHKKKKDENWLSRYTRDEIGFVAWCTDNDEKYETEMEEYFSRVIGVGEVICRAEFIQYVQWHNLAVVVTQKHKMPVHVVHYEDYENNFDDIANDLLSFLHLKKKGNWTDFHLSDYSAYFTDEQRTNTITLLKSITSPAALEKVGRYYTSDKNTL